MIFAVPKGFESSSFFNNLQRYGVRAIHLVSLPAPEYALGHIVLPGVIKFITPSEVMCLREHIFSVALPGDLQELKQNRIRNKVIFKRLLRSKAVAKNGSWKERKLERNVLGKKGSWEERQLGREAVGKKGTWEEGSQEERT